MTFENRQLDTSQLPQVSEVLFHKLEKGYLSVMLLRFSIFSIAMIFSLVVLYIFQPVDEVQGFVYVVLLVLGLIYIALRYFAVIKGFENKAYALRQKDIVYKTGWLWKSITTTPFNRVQHVSIEQGPIERRWNLARLKLYTAGGNTSDLSIPGLNHRTAEELKEFIASKTRIGDQEEE